MAPSQKDWVLGVDSWRAVGKISTCLGDVAQLGERCRRMAEAEGSTPFVSTLGFDKPLTMCRRLFLKRKGCTMAELESQPLSDEERAELEELRAEKARREAREEARREREELAALRAERAKAEEAAASAASEPAPAPKPAAAKPAPAAPKPQPKKVAHSKPVEPKPSRDEMTFAQRMVTSKEPTGENEIPGMAPAQKIIIVLALIAFIVFMVYTITGSMGLH